MKTIFISADHGLAIVYFLQSDVVPTLLDASVQVVLLTDDALTEHIARRFGRPGLTVEGLRFKQARRYWNAERPAQQYWLDFFRRAGASNKINLEAVESYIYQVKGEAQGKRKMLFPLMHSWVQVLRRSQAARRALIDWQSRFTPNLYGDLFDKYRPDMVVASTPGWRSDRYLLREAAARGITNTAVIVGWDNSSSYSIPGARMDHITCWSQLQKDELIHGSDWDPARVHIGGIPSYDGYFNRKWLMPRDEYFKLHGLDPARKLISYASSFITFSPNIQNIEALARLVASNQLAEPSQLLVRLHPNHFLDVPRFAAEREQVRRLVRKYPSVHMVEPVSLADGLQHPERRPTKGRTQSKGGGELGYYSGEDMDEKSSMMAHSDVFTTVYSTMVVEASCHSTPVVSVCIDHKVGWTDKFYLPLSQIGGWPTHARFRDSGAGRVATTQRELGDALNRYLATPGADAEARQRFIQNECTHTDGSAGKRTGEYLLSLL